MPAFLQNNIFSIIAAAVSIAAIVVSIRSHVLAKRALYANVLATNRIKWVVDLRDKLGEFAESYYSCERDNLTEYKSKLRQKAFEIELFLDYSGDNAGYNGLRDQLRVLVEATESPSRTDLFDELIVSSQKVLGDAYYRAKLEAGVSVRLNKSMSRKVLKAREESSATPTDDSSQNG